MTEIFNRAAEKALLLVIDVGNTNITFGLFDGDKLDHQWRIASSKSKTSDEFGIEMEQILEHFHYHREMISGIIIGSVVPDLMHTLSAMCRRFLKLEPIIVGDGTRTGMAIRLDNPKEVGADRIVNAVAGFEKYGGPLIIVDIGTAITHDVISASGEYLGGAISPGIGIAAEALFLKTAKLPKIQLETPKHAIGRNTVEALQAGLVNGFIGLIDSNIEAIVKELNAMGQPHPTIVATGGFSLLLAQHSRYIDLVDKDITLNGLRLVYERTMKAKR